VIDADLLAYDHDEERHGFGEPVTPEGVGPRPLPAATRASLALVGLGLLALVVVVLGGPGNGTWGGFLASFGLISVGAVLTFWTELRGTTAGIKHDGVFFGGLTHRGALGWIAGILMTGIYVLLYFEPSYLGYVPAVWGSEGLVEEAKVTGGLVKTVEPLARALGVTTSQWFLYGVLYTLAILVFGVRMFMKYRHNRYHQVRTASVMFFQAVFAWYLPQLLVRFQKPYMEFNGVWPLKYDYLWPEKVEGQLLGAGTFGTMLLVFAIAGVIATPILTYFFGKRWYCSWVCGCGGLAETLGDPWRQLSSKSTRSWKLERWLIHGILVLVVVTTLMLWVDSLTTGNLYGSWSGPFRNAYGFYIGAIFSGVVGVGFYPLLGNRVWCRFGCPQAAILGIFQRGHLPALLLALPHHDQRRPVHVLRQLLDLLRAGHRRARLCTAVGEHRARLLRRLRRVRGGVPARRAQARERAGRRPLRGLRRAAAGAEGIVPRAGRVRLQGLER
jgi:hypothetical protein